MKRGILIFILFTIFITACTSQDEVSSTHNIVEFNGEREDIKEIQEREDNNQEEGKEHQSIQEQHWQRIFAKVFEPEDCPKPRDPNTLPDGYYKDSMIDTHIHIGHLPEGDIPQGEQHPIMGYNVNMADYVCMMDYENTSAAFAFFPVWDPIIHPSIEVVQKTLENYPGRFVPFIMPPDHDDRADGFPTVDAQALNSMLSISAGLFSGYGEIGLYERGDHGGPKGALALPPDSSRLEEIYPVVREHNLLVYFHLGEGQKESFEAVLKANPDINFIWHGDQLIPNEDGKDNRRNFTKFSGAPVSLVEQKF